MILYLHYFNACTPVFYNVSMYLISNMILYSDDHGAAACDPQAVAGAGWRAGPGGGAGRGPGQPQRERHRGGGARQPGDLHLRPQPHGMYYLAVHNDNY